MRTGLSRWLRFANFTFLQPNQPAGAKSKLWLCGDIPGSVFQSAAFARFNVRNLTSIFFFLRLDTGVGGLTGPAERSLAFRMAWMRSSSSIARNNARLVEVVYRLMQSTALLMWKA